MLTHKQMTYVNGIFIPIIVPVVLVPLFKQIYITSWVPLVKS